MRQVQQRSLFPQFLFGALALRDIAGRRKYPLHFARFVLVHAGVVEHIRHAARGVPDGQRVIPHGAALEHLPVSFSRLFGFREVIAEIAPGQFLARNSGRLLRSLVHIRDLPLATDRHQRIQAGLDQLARIPRRRAQPLFRPPLLGHVQIHLQYEP